MLSAVVAFSPNVGSALSNAVIGLLGSIVGGALGMMIIALISGLALGYSYETHPVTMVRSPQRTWQLPMPPALHAQMFYAEG